MMQDASAGADSGAYARRAAARANEPLMRWEARRVQGQTNLSTVLQVRAD